MLNLFPLMGEVGSCTSPIKGGGLGCRSCSVGAKPNKYQLRGGCPMANVYPEPGKDRPEKKSDEPASQKTMGMYDRPKRKGPSKGVIIAIVLVIIIMAWVLLAGFAYAAESGFENRLAADTTLVVEMVGIS